VKDESKFFKGLGARIRALRQGAGYSQEDMISHGFSVRYWQKVEAGKPITLRTLLRICRLFSAPMADVVRGLDEIPRKGLAVRQTTGRF
jgi:transcriptional regulator with XRE-family HTH domain